MLASGLNVRLSSEVKYEKFLFGHLRATILRNKMKFCNRCLYPQNHTLNLIIDKDGVCSGCRVHEEKYQIDWVVREKELNTFVVAIQG
jgi:hypothetical protein